MQTINATTFIVINKLLHVGKIAEKCLDRRFIIVLTGPQSAERLEATALEASLQRAAKS